MKLDPFFITKNSINHLFQKLVFSNGHTWAKPVRITLVPTEKCNCRCQMCPVHLRSTPDLDFTAITSTLDLIRSWLGPFFLNLSGGEFFMYENAFPLLTFCKEIDVHPRILTNGVFLNEKHCKQLSKSGVKSLRISIDSLKPGLHDSIRGWEGLLDRILQGIQFLRKYEIQVGITTVISRMNSEELESLTKTLLEEHGIANIVFQPIDLKFIKGDPNPITSKMWIQDLESFKNSIDSLIRLKQAGYSIDNSHQTLRSFVQYFDSSSKPAAPYKPCLVGTRDLIIDVHGNVRFCWPLEPFGNIMDSNFDPAKLWNSEKAKSLRRKALKCRINCTAACHRSLSLKDKITAYWRYKT